MLFPEPFGCCRPTHYPSTLQACSKTNYLKNILNHNPVTKIIP